MHALRLYQYRPAASARLASGFTLIEAMVTVAILAVLAAIAGPSFQPLIEKWRVQQAVSDLQSTLYYARSEAIKRSGQIAIQKIPNNTNGCTSANDKTAWDCGWIVCHDINHNGKCATKEPVLQRIEAPARVQITRTGGSESIKINRWGLVDGTWLGFSFVPLNQSTTHPAARGVCMSSGGRIRVILPEEIPCRKN